MKTLAVGDSHESSFQFTADKVREFAELTGDTNPLHLDEAYAATRSFGKPIVHGMFVASLFSRVLGMQFPGEGTIYLGQQLKFTAPVFTDDRVEVKLEVLAVGEKGRVTIRTRVFREDRTLVVDGEALVIAPRGAVAG